MKRLFIFFSPFFPPLHNLCFYLYVHRLFPLSPQLQVFYLGYHIFQSYDGHLVLLWIFCFFAETFHVIIVSGILVILALKSLSSHLCPLSAGVYRLSFLIQVETFSVLGTIMILHGNPDIWATVVRDSSSYLNPPFQLAFLGHISGR